jgi:hypothetical protein
VPWSFPQPAPESGAPQPASESGACGDRN